MSKLDLAQDCQATAAIPKIIHRIWLAQCDIPDEHEVYWRAWQRQLPEFEFRTWRTDDVADLRTRTAIARADGVGRKEHIARYEILLTHGGIFLESGFAPYHRFPEDLMRHELVVCSEIESAHYCSTAFIAAAPGARALAWAVKTLLVKPLNEAPANVEAGPWLLRQALEHGPAMRLPAAAFFPYLIHEPMSALYERDLTATYAIPVLLAQGQDARQQRARADVSLELGDLKLTIEQAGVIGAASMAPIVDFCQLARSARTTALEAARHEIVASRICTEDQPALSFLKAAFFLMGQVPDLLVWQIGAGDGIAGDVLRPLLVNYDPAALLVEPNPYLYAALVDNYRNNTGVRCVQALHSEWQGRQVLYAANPANQSELALPEWTNGMSSTRFARSGAGRPDCDPDTLRRARAALEPIEVAAYGVDDLLAVHAGVQPGIVVIDIEGAEADTVLAIANREIRPFILNISRRCLSQHEVDLVVSLLEADYWLFPDGDRILAYRVDFVTLYCEQLYVEHGIPTVYRDALRFALRLH